MEEMKLELERRRRALAKLRLPVISARMRFGGLRTRTQRREIVRYRGEVARQKKSYKESIKQIKTYLKAKQEFENLKPIANGHTGPMAPMAPTAPMVSLFDSPMLRRVKGKTKLSALKRYH